MLKLNHLNPHSNDSDRVTVLPLYERKAKIRVHMFFVFVLFLSLPKGANLKSGKIPKFTGVTSLLSIYNTEK